MACDFIIQLSKLRKLSAESVENIKSFDAFKKYMHVERPVEKELRDLLHHVHGSMEKCLVLLCGSAGDGKSHLISYLKNADPEGLLADFEPYNDATESSAPTLTSIDTLAEKLKSFDDDHYLDNDGKKMIVAINLGTLNNFIESEKGKKYSRLKEYVESNGIFAGYSQESSYIENSIFQHVSFSDYQVFSLGEDGIETAFLNALFEKVFRKSSDNPFYNSYINNCECPLGKRCPVRHNYEFLSQPEVQKALIERIIEAVIKDKALVSTREVLNLLYDLMVHPGFDPSSISVGTSDIKYLTDYISWTTPMLLNEFEDISPFLNLIRKHDVLKRRNSHSDNEAMRFHALDNIQDVFSNATENTPYRILENLTSISVLGGIKSDLKKNIYRFIMRINALKDSKQSVFSDLRMFEFVKYLYYQKSGQEKKLGDLYTATKKAVMSWDGQFDEDYICIDDTNDQMWILEQLYLKPFINKTISSIDGTIQRFSPTLNLRFRKDSSDEAEVALLNVDFALYELISNMKEGYRPTVQDKNRHADFVGFVQQLINFGNKDARIILVPKKSDKAYKMIFEDTDFGYEFKVIKNGL